MKERNEIQKELGQLSNKIAPQLEELKNDSPYKIPFKYFEGMQEAVFQKLEKQTVKKELSFWDNLQNGWHSISSPRAIVSLASIAILVAGLVLFTNNSSTPTEDIFASVDISTIETLVEMNIESYESEELFDLATFINIENLNSAQTSENDFLEEFIDDMDEEEILNLF